jgi:putative phage-type endonuclease
VTDFKEIAQGSADWLAARLGRVTASRMNDVCAAETTAAYQNYLWQLVAERLTGQQEETYVNNDMLRGTEKEPIARAAYEAHTGRFVTQTGLWLHPTIEWFGASPDGLLDDGEGLIEIKNPRTSTHLRYRSEGKPPTTYKRQMIAQLLCTGRKYVDFVSFDDRLPENRQLFIARFEPKQAEVDELLDKTIRFLAKVAEECK